MVTVVSCRHAHKLPITMSALPSRIDIIRSRERILLSTNDYYQKASTYKFFYDGLCAGITPVSPFPTIHREHHAYICKLAQSFGSDSLIPFWDIMSSFSDYLLSLILCKRVSQKYADPEFRTLQVFQVFKGDELDTLCIMLVLELLG